MIRCRLVEVHVHLMAYMRERVLSKWMGKKEEQEWVCSPEGMRHCYEATQRRHSLSRGAQSESHPSQSLSLSRLNSQHIPFS